MEPKNIIFKHTLKEYNKKYRHHKNLLKFTKKEVEDFDKAANTIGAHKLLDHNNWWFIDDTYYQVPKTLHHYWFRNLNAGAQTAICLLGAGAVASAITVPLVLLNQNKPVEEKHAIEIDGEYSDYVKVDSQKTLASGALEITLKPVEGGVVAGMESLSIGNQELVIDEDYTLKGNVVTIKKEVMEKHKDEKIIMKPIIQMKKKEYTISLDHDSYTFKVGEEFTLTATVTEKNGDEPTLFWGTTGSMQSIKLEKISNTQRKIVAQKAGTCQVTVACTGGNTAICNITVEDSKPEFTEINVTTMTSDILEEIKVIEDQKISVKVQGFDGSARTNISALCDGPSGTLKYKAELVKGEATGDDHWEITGAGVGEEDITFTYQKDTSLTVTIPVKITSTKNQFITKANKWVSSDTGFLNTYTEYSEDDLTVKVNGGENPLDKFEYQYNPKTLIINAGYEIDITLAGEKYSGDELENVLKDDTEDGVTYIVTDDYIFYEDTNAEGDEYFKLKINKLGYVELYSVGNSDEYEIEYKNAPIERSVNIVDYAFESTQFEVSQKVDALTKGEDFRVDVKNLNEELDVDCKVVIFNQNHTIGSTTVTITSKALKHVEILAKDQDWTDVNPGDDYYVSISIEKKVYIDFTSESSIVLIDKDCSITSYPNSIKEPSLPLKCTNNSDEDQLFDFAFTDGNETEYFKIESVKLKPSTTPIDVGVSMTDEQWALLEAGSTVVIDITEHTELKTIDVEWDEGLGYYTGSEFSFSKNEDFGATIVGNDEDNYDIVTFRDADGDKLPVGYQGSAGNGIVVTEIVDNDGNVLVEEEDFKFNSLTYEFSFAGYKTKAEVTFKCTATADLDYIEVRGITAKTVILSDTAITPEGYSVSNIPPSVTQGGDGLTFKVTNDTGESTDNTIDIYEEDSWHYLGSIDVTLNNGDNTIRMPNSSLNWDEAREDVEYVIEVCEPEEPITSKTIYPNAEDLDAELLNEGIILEDYSSSTSEDEGGEIALSYINETGESKTLTIIATDLEGNELQNFGDVTFIPAAEPETATIFFNNWTQVEDGHIIYLKLSR